MTSTQQIQLDAAFADYTAKKNTYDADYAAWSSANAHSNDTGWQQGMVAPLKAKADASKQAMDSAFTAYNTLKDSLAAQAQAEFNLANPSAAVAIQQSQAQAAVETAAAQAEAKRQEAETKAKTLMDMQAATFAQSKSQVYLYVGVGLVIVFVLGFGYFKLFKSAPKTPVL